MKGKLESFTIFITINVNLSDSHTFALYDKQCRRMQLSLLLSIGTALRLLSTDLFSLFVSLFFSSHSICRAEKLLGGLGGEKTRWGEAAQSLHKSINNIVGDVLLAGGCTAYLGFFPTEVSIKIKQKYQKKKQRIHIRLWIPPLI